MSFFASPVQLQLVNRFEQKPPTSNRTGFPLIHLLIFTTPCYASAVYAVVVCLSLHPSVTRLYCIKTAKCRIMQTMPYDSPGTLVF